jgi:hypothetical protein
MNEASATFDVDTGQSARLVHTGAVVSGTAIGLGVAVVAGALWSAEAFTNTHSVFYNHLTWWFGGTLMGAAFIGALVAAAVSASRGPAAGLMNGLATSGALTAIGGLIALAALATAGSTASLIVNGTTISVDLFRPFVAFWSGLIALVAGGVAGVAGGMIPRRVRVFGAASESQPSTNASMETQHRAA